MELGRRRSARIVRTRVRLADGARTTLHAAWFDLAEWRPRVVSLGHPQPLVRWCREAGVSHSIVGGFFLRPECRPLGELRLGGGAMESVPFDAPWGEVRACLHVEDGNPRIARRDRIAQAPRGDLLQAGPLLVSGGRRAISDDADAEGFSAGARQFDSDITRGRYPRAALALEGGRMLAVACDGRNTRDAGMTLTELADALVAMGAEEALNLDGGGSASLVFGGRLRNRPREEHGIDLLDGRPVVTAVAFDRR